MADMMNFPKRWEDFLHDYEFEDSRRVYTNGSRLIPSFRVEQMMEHYALRPVSRGQVKKVWRGEWRDLHGDKLVGIDDVGQDVYRHYHYSVCKKCGKGIAAKSNFCPYCGDAKTDEAVQMVMERMEKLHEDNGCS